MSHLSNDALESMSTQFLRDCYTTIKDENDVVTFYGKWASKYDQIYTDYLHTQIAQTQIADYLTQQHLPKDCRILDVAAGTGLVGLCLHNEYGYTNIDAHDGSPEMLELAKGKNVYKNLICCFLGGGHTLPVEENVYDAAVVCGGLCPGHLKCDSFLELIRVVKPGGIIVNLMREDNVRKDEEYKKLHSLFAQWEAEGKWAKIDHVIPEEKLYKHYDALIHIYRVK